MESKPIYPDTDFQRPPSPPPSYNTAIGLVPPQPQQHHYQPQQEQHHYQPQQEQHHYQPPLQNPVIIPQPVIITQPAVGPDPIVLICPHCRSEILSRVEYEPGTKTHLAAIFLCLFGCWCCPCLPYCIDACKNGNHYCPNCGDFIGSYKS